MKINIEHTIKRFKVLSRSEKGKFRIVELNNNGKLSCNCPAGEWSRPCRHKEVIVKHL